MTVSILVAAAALAGVVAGLAVRRWVVAPARVESSSMEPTLRSGQRLVVRRRGTVEPVRGDVVLVRSAEVGRVLVKRVIGLPGERIEIDGHGGVRVDGRTIHEPYVGGVPRHGPQQARDFARTFEVPKGHLLLLGDNRAASSDSRSWKEPYLPATAVVGRVVGIQGGHR
jgi:signal peptidase I